MLTDSVSVPGTRHGNYPRGVLRVAFLARFGDLAFALGAWGAADWAGGGSGVEAEVRWRDGAVFS